VTQNVALLSDHCVICEFVVVVRDVSWQPGPSGTLEPGRRALLLSQARILEGVCALVERVLAEDAPVSSLLKNLHHR
jgi:hypothetical protein